MLLDQHTIFVKEHVGMLKLTDTYDLLDPESGTKLGEAREEPGNLVKYLRLIINKRLMPTALNVYEEGKAEPVLSINRPFAIFRPAVEIRDSDGNVLATLRSKIFTLGPSFDVLDPQGQVVASVKGDWKGWNFKFSSPDNQEIGTVTKKWAGVAKELFTSADNYVIHLSNPPKNVRSATAILLAAGLAIDTIYKEQ